MDIKFNIQLDHTIDKYREKNTLIRCIWFFAAGADNYNDDLWNQFVIAFTKRSLLLPSSNAGYFHLNGVVFVREMTACLAHTQPRLRDNDHWTDIADWLWCTIYSAVYLIDAMPVSESLSPEEKWFIMKCMCLDTTECSCFHCIRTMFICVFCPDILDSPLLNSSNRVLWSCLEQQQKNICYKHEAVGYCY